MADVFQVIPSDNLATLEEMLEVVFSRQAKVDLAAADLSSAPSPDAALVDAKEDAETYLDEATQLLNAVEITLVDLVQHFQSLEESTIRQSNSYYAQYGAVHTVENLSWTKDKLLESCEEPLRDKLREGLVGVSSIEKGGPLIFKHMLDLIMDVDAAALRSLTQSLQTLCLQDIPCKDVSIASSYLKGVLLLL